MNRFDLRLRRRIFLTEFFGECLPIYALVPLYFAEYVSLSALQIGLVLGMWQFATVLFELPTGSIADKYGRRKSMQIGKAIRIVAFPIWLMFPSFLGASIGIIFLALGDALLSGSLEAYSYDELRDKKSFNKLRQQTSAVHLGAFTVAALISFVLGADYRSILIASIVMSVLSLMASTALPREKEWVKEHLSVAMLVDASKRVLAKGSVTSSLFLKATIILATMIVFVEQINIFYSDTGLSARSVALLMAIGNGITFVLLWTAHRYERYVRTYQISLPLSTIGFLLLAVFLDLNIWLQVGGIFIYVRILRLSMINSSNVLQHVIESRTRATIQSLLSLIAKIVSAIVIVCIGFVSQQTGDIRYALSVSGLVMILLFVYLHHKSKVQSNC